ncbi:hypothetical protein [Streptomyces canus]|uniref:hypothetical protein n=1 Tax=Streptomyces canus TaxID=58343 RepID=UPI0032551207
MRTTTAGRAVHTAAVAAGAVLVAGCGSDVAPAASAATSPAAFGQKVVQADLDAAIGAAGLPQGKTEAGYPEGGGAASGEKVQQLAVLVTRLSPCVVSWSSDGAREPLDVLLSGLEKRGWESAGVNREAPSGKGGTYFMATYEKQGWTLNARHNSLQRLNQSTVMATEDACFARLTDEELALVEGD